MRRAERLRVLAAVCVLIPRSQDASGRAFGILAEQEIGKSAGVSHNAVARSIKFWRGWRVLWLHWRGSRHWEIRFERALVDNVLAAEAKKRQDVGAAHRKQREAVAPWNPAKVTN